MEKQKMKQEPVSTKFAHAGLSTVVAENVQKFYHNHFCMMIQNGPVIHEEEEGIEMSKIQSIETSNTMMANTAHK